MDLGDKLLLIFFCVIRICSFFCIGIILFVLSQKRRIATPIRLIHIIIYPFLLPATVTTFIASVYYIITDNFTINATLLLIQRYLQSTSGNVIRFSIFFLLIERLIATAYWDKYEKSSKMKNVCITVGFVIVFLALIYAYVLVVITIPEWVSYSVMGSMQAACFVLAWCLIWQNNQLRERTKNVPFLSQRYQLVENIRILQFLKSFIFLITAVISFGPISGVLIPLVTSKVYIRNHVFYLSYDMYFSICAYFFYKECKRRAQIDQVPASTRKVLGWTESTVHTEPHVTTVTTALGKAIPVKQSLDAHFNQLKDSWKI